MDGELIGAETDADSISLDLERYFLFPRNFVGNDDEGVFRRS